MRGLCSSRFSTLVLAVSILGIVGCGKRISRRHIFPNGFVGSFYIVMDENAQAMERNSGWLIVEFDDHGIAYMNKADEKDYREWGTDEFQYANGDPIVSLLPGTSIRSVSAEIQGSTVTTVSTDLKGKQVQLPFS